MKHFYLLTLLCFCVMVASAQEGTGSLKKLPDTIAKRDGEKLVVVLTEVNPNDIRYKRFDYQDGPSFTLAKQDISYITYANGKKESFENYVAPVVPRNGNDLSIQSSGWKYYYKERMITEPDMLDIAEKLHDKKLDLMIAQVDKRRVWHTITLLGGIFLMADGAYIVAANRLVRYHRGGGRISANTTSQQEARNIGVYLFAGGVACEGVTLYLRFNRRRYAHYVMDMYNQDIAK